jgi:hypothetical protein
MLLRVRYKLGYLDHDAIDVGGRMEAREPSYIDVLVSVVRRRHTNLDIHLYTLTSNWDCCNPNDNHYGTSHCF